MTPTLHRITVYPIKSLDGVSVEAIDLLPSGALAWDRRFAIVDSRSQMITGKKTPVVHAIRSEVDLDEQSITLEDKRRPSTSRAHLSLVDATDQIGEWLSDAFEQSCRLIENTSQGFPDDAEALGPTIVSTESLRTVACWFDGISLDEMRRRFRANLEIDAPEPFWEDCLVGESVQRPVRFRVGHVAYFGLKPCQRCAVPPRSSETGEATPNFMRGFMHRREETLPEFAPRDRFDHFYRLAVNTSLAAAGESPRLNVGDSIVV